MTRDIFDIQDFTVLMESAESEEIITDACHFDEPVIGVAFYGAGDVEMRVSWQEKQRSFAHTKGLALSFYADEEVAFVHEIAAQKPLACIVIATTTRNLAYLPHQGGELFADFLQQLVKPEDHYVEGPTFLMTPEMQGIVDQLFRIEYQGKARMMFFRSQITVLLSHYFGQLSLLQQQQLLHPERAKLEMARDILAGNLESPPSLSELARQIGLNTFKLKKQFKELFGVPVFKYLQQQRLNKAHELLRLHGATVQEAAWEVGYDSLSSFSKAFVARFGFRPSEIKQ